MKNNIHSNMTEEDGFDRLYACWCLNRNNVQHRRFRRRMKIQLLRERAENERF